MTRALLLCWVSTTVLAADVYVNGVNVNGLTNHTFERVTVRIDDKGDVQIDAPGYSVKKVTLSADSASGRGEGVISQRYFLVAEQNPPGMTEYDVDLFLNGKFLRTIRNGDEQLVTDVTKSLKPGRNTVVVQAKKNYADADRPKSQSAKHVFRVIIGEGSAKDDQVVIEKQVLTFTRTAADSGDATQEYSFTTR